MPSYTIYSNEDDHGLANYSGTTVFYNTDEFATDAQLGVLNYLGTVYRYEYLPRFDTSSIVGSFSTGSFNIHSQGGDALTAKLRAKTWSSPSTGNWVDHGSLSALLLLGSASFSGAAGLKSITLSAVTVSASWSMLLHTQHHESGNTTSQLAPFYTANYSGTTNDPYLSITTSTAITGTGSNTLGAVTSSAAGTVAFAPITGTASNTLGAITGSGVGTVPIVGAGAATLGDVIASGGGVVPIVGAGATSLGDITASGEGTIQTVTLGSLEATLGDVSSSGAGSVPMRGQGDSTLAAVACDGAGTVAYPPATGVASISLGGVTVLAAGIVVENIWPTTRDTDEDWTTSAASGAGDWTTTRDAQPGAWAA